MNKKYDSKDILVLEGLDAVRLRPGMYIGTTGQKGLHHLLWEIVDNSIDEVSNGFGNNVTVTLFPDGSAQVKDNGRGIPVDKHPLMGVSGVEVVFTQLHAGGKFNNESYSYSGGLHGVGASVTNALSEWLDVTICREGKKYEMRFESILKNGKIQSGAVVQPLSEKGSTSDFGTTVRFLPDSRVFEDTTFSYEVISKRLKELAFLNKGIEIVLIDQTRSGQPSTQTFKYDGGLKDFVLYLNTNKEVSHPNPVYIYGKTDLISVECAFQYASSYTENLFSYVNNIPTSEGGTHETGFKSALTRAFNDMGRRLNLLKDKEDNPMGEDYREGMTIALAVKMRNVQFEGQTKTKLGNPEVKSEVEGIIYNQLVTLFEKNENKTVLELAIKKGRDAARVREAARKVKEIARQKNSIENSNLIGKLSSASGKKPELNELFIVEGESAGGSAKQARDRSFQAILPLRGKPLNAEKKKLAQVLANEEIRTIISALGTGIGEDFNLSALKYHKVVILSDADQDGAHIRAILLTFFFRYMKELVTQGHLYIGQPPLYKVEKKNFMEYIYSDIELPKVLEKAGKGYIIQRYKGLGEMNPDQLWNTTMNPASRTLLQVNVEDAADAELMITTWMGDNVEARKGYISEHANFNKKDKFADTKI